MLRTTLCTIVVVITSGLCGAADSHEPLALVEKGGRWSFINAKGERVFGRDFDLAGEFSEGLAPVEISGQWGYIDGKGKTIIEPQFAGTGSFSEGLASVKIAGKEGFIDKSAQVVIQPAFDLAWPFTCGFAMVELDQKRGYINRQGKIVVELQFEMAYPFSEGLAYVRVNGKKEVMDPAGRKVIEVDEGASTFSEGLAAAEINGKWGFIDTAGNWVISPRFGGAYNFSERLAYVSEDPTHSSFIDRSGKVVIRRPRGAVGCEGLAFSEGLTVVTVKGRCGFMDRNGKIAFATPLKPGTLVESFSEGLARFWTRDSPPRWGYINKSGKVAIAPRFDSASDFFLPSSSMRMYRCNRN
jgi:hypothetical protein